MSFVKVVLLAVMAAVLNLAYIAIPVFVGLPQFLGSRSFGNFGTLLISCLSATATLIFLVVLWRDSSGLPAAITLRHAGLIAAVARSVSLISIFFLFHTFSLTFLLRFFLPSAAWVAFFLTFFVLPDPLSDSLTRGLAGILAVFTGANAVMAVYEMVNRGAFQQAKAGVSTWDAMRIPAAFVISLCSALSIGALLICIARGNPPAKSNTVESL
jgi:hypothetical protein